MYNLFKVNFHNRDDLLRALFRSFSFPVFWRAAPLHEAENVSYYFSWLYCLAYISLSPFPLSKVYISLISCFRKTDFATFDFFPLKFPTSITASLSIPYIVMFRLCEYLSPTDSIPFPNIYVFSLFLSFLPTFFSPHYCPKFLFRTRSFPWSIFRGCQPEALRTSPNFPSFILLSSPSCLPLTPSSILSLILSRKLLVLLTGVSIGGIMYRSTQMIVTIFNFVSLPSYLLSLHYSFHNTP